jgi:hypothetical protein
MFAATRLASSSVIDLEISASRLSAHIHISDNLLIGVYDLEAAFYGFNGPWCWESPHAVFIA